MSTIDYDTPRRSAVDLDEDSLEELRAHRASAQSASVDVDEGEAAEAFELPGADLSDEELTQLQEQFKRIHERENHNNAHAIADTIEDELEERERS